MTINESFQMRFCTNPYSTNCTENTEVQSSKRFAFSKDLIFPVQRLKIFKCRKILKFGAKNSGVNKSTKILNFSVRHFEIRKLFRSIHLSSIYLVFFRFSIQMQLKTYLLLKVDSQQDLVAD